MAVVSSRGMNNLLVEVADMDLVDLEEARGALMVAAEYLIKLLWGLDPPSTTNTVEEVFWNDSSGILGVDKSLRVIYTVPAINM